jgi:opacity protein-like surface antigen
MKKKILALLAGSMLASSIGFAAPISDLAQSQATIGYDHYSLSHDTSNNSIYLEGALSDKFTLGVEHNNNSADGVKDWNTTDVYVQYKVDPNVRLILGNRNYDYNNQSDKVFYGVGFTANLAPRLDGYASVITNSTTTEWQAGVNYALSDNVALNVAYKNNKDSDYPTYDGVGIGLNCKF